MKKQTKKFRIWMTTRWWFPGFVAANILWWIIDIVTHATA